MCQICLLLRCCPLPLTAFLVSWCPGNWAVPRLSGMQELLKNLQESFVSCHPFFHVCPSPHSARPWKYPSTLSSAYSSSFPSSSLTSPQQQESTGPELVRKEGMGRESLFFFFFFSLSACPLVPREGAEVMNVGLHGKNFCFYHLS